jgi:DNA invertase Pin-like site-specific DNA recombinase
VRASAPLARGKTARSLAERRGWTVAGVYEDNDVSAFKTKVTRPEFGHLMEDL